MDDLVLTRDQVRRIDELAVSQYRMPSLLLMENAGRGAAEVICREYGSTSRALICCGGGNNGGDGFVIARHLHNAGWSVRLVTIAAMEKMTPDARSNYEIAEAMAIPIKKALDTQSVAEAFRELTPNDLVIDALLGTGFTGQVRSPFADAIELINQAKKRAVVAIDVPSGLDCDSGTPSNATIRADLTITFVAPKKGLLTTSAAPYIGRVEVVPIGAPRELIEAVAREATG